MNLIFFSVKNKDMDIRTDLISELNESSTGNQSGIKTQKRIFGEVTADMVDVLTPDSARRIGKPCGRYLTVSFERLDRIADLSDVKAALLYSLQMLFPTPPESVLVVGLGNTDITPDALGPLTANSIIATRHISGNLRHTLGLDGLKDVSCLIPGVLGKTGIESLDIVSAAAAETKPDAIIVVDALAARDPKRLCSTVQLSNSGITPGSGVNNARKELSGNKLHIPVIAIGIPTVTDADRGKEKNDMMVTPKEIDLLIKKGSELLSFVLNRFLQPGLDEETIENMT